MSTFIPLTPAATKSAEQHEEPSEQDSFNHLLYKVLRLTSEQVQDINDWMKHCDTIPTRNGRELSEIWVSKVGTNF